MVKMMDKMRASPSASLSVVPPRSKFRPLPARSPPQSKTSVASRAVRRALCSEGGERGTYDSTGTGE
jgi:hypothetical protein